MSDNVGRLTATGSRYLDHYRTTDDDDDDDDAGLRKAGPSYTTVTTVLTGWRDAPFHVCSTFM